MYIREAIDNYVGRACYPGTDYKLQDDGAGVYIKEWNITSIVQPTMAQLDIIVTQSTPSIELEILRQQKFEENQANYDVIRNGVKVVNGVPINIDPVSCGNLVGCVVGIMSGISVVPVVWMCDRNIEHRYTMEEFSALCVIIFNLITDIQRKLSANKLSIASATTTAELNAISTDYSTL
jgi:hypothetical protein